MMWRSNKQHTFLKMALQGSGAVENGGRIWLAWISGGVTDEVDLWREICENVSSV